METLHFSIDIDADKQRVWDAMLEDATYQEWTGVFAPGSRYVGRWEEGERLMFLAPAEDGTTHGMVSEVVELRPHEFVSIRHLGTVRDGVEDREQAWVGALENYTLTAVDGATQVRIDIDIEDEYVEEFERLWPAALTKLKEIAER